MEKKLNQVYIVGAGISGLIAAHVLEKQGISPVVIESSDRVGGRLKTDLIKGYQLDKGFQVLLSSYSAAKKYLDYKTLNLQKLKAGACVFIDGKQVFFGDPLRDPTVLFSTLFSGIGSVSDKIKIAKLNFKLQKKTIESIFEDKEVSTKKYLINLGFSESVITNFFYPFFSGIFLESKLDTSSRMFEFVFKMFGSGYAVLPSGGIEEISKQLKNNLQKTKFIFNSKVSSVNNKEIRLSNDDCIVSDYTIIATEPGTLISNLKNQRIKWKSCQNLYFTCPKRVIKNAYIGLIPGNNLINNIFYPTSIKNDQKGNSELISITVVKKHNLSEKELINQVKKELKHHCNIESLKFLKIYNISKALPNLDNLQYEISPTETKLKEGVFLAGDVLLNGSLNAAMIAGERAAMGVLEAMGKRKLFG